MKNESFLMIALIITTTMIGVTLTPIVTAMPQQTKYNSHEHFTYDPETGDVNIKGGSNQVGPFGHENCKISTDEFGNVVYNCKAKYQ